MPRCHKLVEAGETLLFFMFHSRDSSPTSQRLEKEKKLRHSFCQKRASVRSPAGSYARFDERHTTTINPPGEDEKFPPRQPQQLQVGDLNCRRMVRIANTRRSCTARIHVVIVAQNLSHDFILRGSFHAIASICQQFARSIHYSIDR
jgi:hypothetical protein